MFLNNLLSSEYCYLATNCYKLRLQFTKYMLHFFALQKYKKLNGKNNNFVVIYKQSFITRFFSKTQFQKQKTQILVHNVKEL